MDRVVFLFLILISSAFSAPLPDYIYSENVILKELRRSFSDKIVQLNQNFAINRKSDFVSYFSNKLIVCPTGESVLPNGVLGQIMSHVRHSGSISEEIRMYTGCNNIPALRERYIIEGEKENLVSTFLNVNLNLEFPNQKSKRYEVLDGLGESVIKFIKVRTREGYQTTIYFNNNLHIRMIYKKDIYFQTTYYPYTFSMSRNGYSFKSDVSAPPRFNTTIFLKSGRIVNGVGETISIAEYQKKRLQGLSFISDSLLAVFPTTEFVSTGTQSVKLLEELRNIFAWLNAGIQQNLVIAKIDEYIKAVEKNLIIDRR